VLVLWVISWCLAKSLDWRILRVNGMNKIFWRLSGPQISPEQFHKLILQSFVIILKWLQHLPLDWIDLLIVFHWEHSRSSQRLFRVVTHCIGFESRIRICKISAGTRMSEATVLFTDLAPSELVHCEAGRRRIRYPWAINTSSRCVSMILVDILRWDELDRWLLSIRSSILVLIMSLGWRLVCFPRAKRRHRPCRVNNTSSNFILQVGDWLGSLIDS